MNDPDSRLDREEIVEQAVRAVQTGRLAVIIADQPVFAGLLGDAAVMLMDSGVDVARLDAFDAHSSDAVREMLCRAMDLDESELIDGLRFRGETGNPFCLVIDSGECLDRKAFILLKTLLEQTAGGLGVLLAGEPDLASFVEDFDLAASWRYELEPDFPLASEEVEGASSGLVLPWKHLAAAAGLALLVLLFWPGDEPDQTTAEIRALALPERSAEVAPVNNAAELAQGDTEETEEVEEVEEFESSSAVPARPSEPDPAPLQADTATGERADTLTESRKAPAATSPVQSEREPVREAAVAESPAQPSPSSSRPRPAAAAETATKMTEPTGGARVADSKTTPPQAKEPTPVVTRDPALSGLDAELNYRQEDWLLALEGSEWLLQVALATTEDGARSLLDRLGRQRAAYYRAQRTGRNVYIVLAGPWSTRQAAVDARATLPQDLRSLGPFPRQAETVQHELVSGHQ